MPQLLEHASRTHHSRADFRHLPEGPPYFELIDGEFVDMPRPGTLHAAVGSRLIRVLGPFADALGGHLTYEPNLYLPRSEDVLHPDLLYLGPGSLEALSADGVYGTPDLVVEILSPGTERRDRTVKRRLYPRAGVPHLWLVDPDSPVLIEAFELGAAGEYVLAATVQSPEVWHPLVFPGCELNLAALEKPRSAPG